MHLKTLLCAAALAMPGFLSAEPVSLTHQGVVLKSELSLAQGKSLKDGVLVLLHGTTAHNRMEIITALEKLLNERGYNTLAVNLGFKVSDRSGMLPCEIKHTHRHEDAVIELDRWLQWLKQKGAGKVTLVGHSRGGNQVLWFANEYPKADVDRVVAIAPMAWNVDDEAKSFEARYKQPLKPLLAKAEQMVKSQQGDALLNEIPFIYCEKTSASAKAFVSYHGDDPRKHSPNQLAKLDKPVLVILGGDDPLTAKVKPGVEALKNKANVQLKTVDGADHFFLDLYAEDAADLIAGFLKP